ncbi:hypothetical protein ABW19_dt0203417 [Dactylella cylindrospora]|nr:hypothetical protein ABW19_dt0203417 [Dactylella cylindrospora]
MIKLTAVQSTHEEWSRRHSLAKPVSEDEGDSTIYFSCEEDSEKVSHTDIARETVESLLSDDDDDDDIIIGSRRRTRGVGNGRPRAMQTIVLSSSDEETDEDEFASVGRQSRAKGVHRDSVLELAETIKSMSLEPLGKKAPGGSKPSRSKPRNGGKAASSILSVSSGNATPKSAFLSSESFRGSDDDEPFMDIPNKFTRPKIFKKSSTSTNIFDISDSENISENDSKLQTFNPRTPLKTAKEMPKAPKTVERMRRKEFEQEKDRLAKEYLKLLDDRVNKGAINRLTTETGGIQLVWTNANHTTAGTCETRAHRVENKITYFTCTVRLEEKVCDSFERIKHVLAHEYTHACVHILEIDQRQLGKIKPHGPLFKSWAKKVAKAMNIPVPQTCHSFEIAYKYEYECPGCRRVFKAHSRRKEWTTTKGCPPCKMPLVQIKPAPRTTKKVRDDGTVENVPTAYQIFQKETFAKIKAEMPPGTPFKFGDIQKEVTRRWKEEKSKRTSLEDSESATSTLFERLKIAENDGQQAAAAGKSSRNSDIVNEFNKLVITID